VQYHSKDSAGVFVGQDQRFTSGLPVVAVDYMVASAFLWLQQLGMANLGIRLVTTPVLFARLCHSSTPSPFSAIPQ
jgi:hypothetical protein